MLHLLLALTSLAGTAEPAEGDVEPSPNVEGQRPAWGPASLAVAISTMRGPDTGVRKLPSSQLTLRLGARLTDDVALELEGLITAGAGPASWYGFDGWGTREDPYGVSASMRRRGQLHPTLGGLGLLVAPRLGVGRVQLAGPRPVPMELVLRLGVRAVWTRAVINLGAAESIDSPTLRPAMLVDLELRAPVHTHVDLGVAGTAQAMSLPVFESDRARTSVNVGLSATLTWSPGRGER